MCQVSVEYRRTWSYVNICVHICSCTFIANALHVHIAPFIQDWRSCFTSIRTYRQIIYVCTILFTQEQILGHLLVKTSVGTYVTYIVHMCCKSMPMLYVYTYIPYTYIPSRRATGYSSWTKITYDMCRELLPLHLRNSIHMAYGSSGWIQEFHVTIRGNHLGIGT